MTSLNRGLNGTVGHAALNCFTSHLRLQQPVSSRGRSTSNPPSTGQMGPIGWRNAADRPRSSLWTAPALELARDQKHLQAATGRESPLSAAVMQR